MHALLNKLSPSATDMTEDVVRDVAPGARDRAQRAQHGLRRARVSRGCASTPTVDLPATAEAAGTQLAIP